MGREEKIGYCALCRSRCGSINVIESGRLTQVLPAPGHPTGGALCTKGRAAPEMIYDPRRVLRPLRRTKPKGDPDPGWVEIGWDEALDEVSRRLAAIRDRDGARAVAFAVTTPAGTPMSDSIEWVERFVRVFGSPNICYATENCKWHQDYLHILTFGGGIAVPDYANADVILLWGYNPTASWLSHATAIGEARKRGARVICVDPRRAGFGRDAEHWLRVKPGADAAVALGLANLLIRNGTFDEQFVRRWSNAPFLVHEDGSFLREEHLKGESGSGRYVVWDDAAHESVLHDPRASMSNELAARVRLRGSLEIAGARGTIRCRPAFDIFAEACAPYTPEHVEEVAWVPAQDLRAAATEIGNARRICYFAWTGVGQQSNASQTERAIALLYALTGCFDAPGGNVRFAKQPANRVNDLSLLTAEQRRSALGATQRPLGPPSQGWITAADLYTAILQAQPYRVRALVGFGSNMLLSQADPQRGTLALQNLEFHVHCDLYLTPTSAHADIVLPVNTPWEREALRIGFDVSADGEELVQLRQQMIPSLGESRSDNAIVFELARRLGMSEQFYGGTLEAGWNHMLRPLGLSVEQLRAQPAGIRLPLDHRFRKYAEPTATGVAGFDTQTRRVEFYSAVLHRHGYPAVPTPSAPRDGDADFPYTLTSAKNPNYCHTEHRGIVSLRRRSPEPRLDLSPQLAATKSIPDGSWVILSTRNGAVRFRARLNSDLHPQVLVGEYGWWQACPELGLPGYAPLDSRGSNFNLLISAEDSDPLSGSVPHRSFACNVEVAPGEDSEGVWSGFREFEARTVLHEAIDVVSLELVPTTGNPPPAFLPGQFLTVRTNVDGKLLTRCYSLSGEARSSDRSSYRITVKRTGESCGLSHHLAVKARAGERLECQAPSGGFKIPLHTEFPVVLIAGGIGITPFMSYLETRAQCAAGPDTFLFYCNRDGSRHAFRDRIAELALQIPQLSTRTYYTAPRDEDRPGRDFDVVRRISASDIPQHLIEGRARFYLCGPETMMRELTDGLVARGVQRFDIFTEAFVRRSAPAGEPNASYDVMLARSKRKLVWMGRGTLLELAERAGLKLGSGCRVGQCESCAVPLLNGSVRYPADLQPPDEATCLTCQAVPASDIVLDA